MWREIKSCVCVSYVFSDLRILLTDLNAVNNSTTNHRIHHHPRVQPSLAAAAASPIRFAYFTYEQQPTVERHTNNLVPLSIRVRVCACVCV